MSTTQPMIRRSLTWLLVTCVVGAMAIGQQPRSAQAGTAANRFTFHPVSVQSNQSLRFVLFNAGGRPTPSAVLHLLDAETGNEFGSPHQIPSLGSAQGDLFSFSPTGTVHVVGLLVFNHANLGQSIPRPLVADLQVIDEETGKVTVVVGPTQPEASKL
jgi:hypothetical protein